MRPVIDARKCPAQRQICRPLTVCDTGALHYVVDEALPLGGKIVIGEELCDGCAKCVTECCGHAIEMRE